VAGWDAAPAQTNRLDKRVHDCPDLKPLVEWNSQVALSFVGCATGKAPRLTIRVGKTIAEGPLETCVCGQAEAFMKSGLSRTGKATRTTSPAGFEAPRFDSFGAPPAEAPTFTSPAPDRDWWPTPEAFFERLLSLAKEIVVCENKVGVSRAELDQRMLRRITNDSRSPRRASSEAGGGASMLGTSRGFRLNKKTCASSTGETNKRAAAPKSRSLTTSGRLVRSPDWPGVEFQTRVWESWLQCAFHAKHELRADAYFI